MRFLAACMFIALAPAAGLAPPASATTSELYQTPPYGSQVSLIANWMGFVEQHGGNTGCAGGDPVFLSTGEFATGAADLLLAGGPRPLGFERHYGAFAGQAAAAWGFYTSAAGPMGASWVHNHQYLIRKTSASQVAIYYLKGKAIFFQKSGGAWQMAAAPAGFVYMGTPYQMVETGTKLEMMDPLNRLVLTFEFASLPAGAVRPVERVRDRNGNLHTYTYNPDRTVSLVTDGLGRSLSFTYVLDAGIPRLVRVTDHTGRFVSFTHGSSRLLTATNARGKTTAYAYTGAHRMTTLTRPRGNVPVSNAVNGAGKCTGQTDGEGNAWGFIYAPNQTRVTDPLGNLRVLDFDAQLRLIRLTDEAGRSATYSYDANHRQIGMTDRLGDMSAIGYHAASGLVSSRTDAEGNLWGYTYLPQAQDGFTFHELSRIDYPDGSFETFGRDARGNIVSHTDRTGEIRTWTRNARGQVTAATNPSGGTETFAYNPSGTLASYTDAGGATTTYAYDALFRLTQLTRPGGATVTYSYDARDNLLVRTDENGHATTWSYDDNDNPATLTDEMGRTTTFAYDGNDDLVSVTGPLGGATAGAYDGLRRLVQRTDPSGSVTSWGYDARRRLVSVTDGAGGTTTYSYDDEGVLVGRTDPSGGTWTYDVDRLGRPVAEHDPLGHAVSYEYDALGRLVRLTDPLGGVSDFTLDAEGNLAAASLPAAASASYARNGFGDVTAITDPRSNLWLSAYDAARRRVSGEDPAGNVTTHAYDSRSRTSLVTFPGGLGTATATWDPASRLTRLLYSDGLDLPFAYDARGRLAAAPGIALAHDADGRVTSSNGLDMTYDAAGRLTGLTVAPGRTVSYTYDAAGRVSGVADWMGGATAFGYDAAGRVTTMTRPNGVTASWNYDAAGRLAGIQEGAIAELAFTRNPRGQITAAARDVPLPAMPPAAERVFGFDAACQDAAAAYDALGRLTSDGARSCGWDLASRLTALDGGAVTFAYDAAGHPISRTEGAATREFVWNYGLLLPSITVVRQGGNDLRYYVHTPDGALLHSIEAAGGARRFFHADQVGNTLFLTDDAAAVTDTYEYGPYGEVLAHGGASDNPFTLQGRFGVMQEGGLHLMRARWYDPAAGRFLSRDPVAGGDPVRINPYQAFFGNPVSVVDPRGTDGEATNGIQLWSDIAFEEFDNGNPVAWTFGKFCRASLAAGDFVGEITGLWETTEEVRLRKKAELDRLNRRRSDLRWEAERNRRMREAAEERPPSDSPYGSQCTPCDRCGKTLGAHELECPYRTPAGTAPPPSDPLREGFYPNRDRWFSLLPGDGTGGSAAGPGTTGSALPSVGGPAGERFEALPRSARETSPGPYPNLPYREDPAREKCGEGH